MGFSIANNCWFASGLTMPTEALCSVNVVSIPTGANPFDPVGWSAETADPLPAQVN